MAGGKGPRGSLPQHGTAPGRHGGAASRAEAGRPTPAAETRAWNVGDGGKHDLTGVGERLAIAEFGQERVGSPGRQAAAKKVAVVGPDAGVQRQGECYGRPRTRRARR